MTKKCDQFATEPGRLKRHWPYEALKFAFGPYRLEGYFLGPNANYQKGASVFNRTLLLKKALVRGGFEKHVSELSARRLLL